MEPQSPLTAWQTFFFLVGSSGAALTGLQFVVIALINESSRRATSREIEAFGTPTIIHFCAVLMMSALLNAPWRGLSRLSFALAVCGVVGVGYGIVVLRRTRRQTTYRPVFEDWLWHAALPLMAYTLLVIASLVLPRHPRESLFVIGGLALLLLFVGIHNSWDAVTYITIEATSPGKPEVPSEQNEPEASRDFHQE